jgi:hypothetical protein
MAFDFKDCVIKRMRLADLKMAEYNPREIGERAFEGLGNSINKFGLLVPIVWNKTTGNIVGGHQRYKHLTEAGETETDVVVVELDATEEVALNITLNNPNIRGGFSTEVIRLLKLSEAQIGSLFNDIRLNDLFRTLKDEKSDNKEKATRECNSDDGPNDSGPPPVTSPSSQPDAVIVCPKCSSRWKMKDNTIILNTTEKKVSR